MSAGATGWSMGGVTDWITSQANVLTNIANSLLPVERL